MKPRAAARRTAALTLVEVLLVVAVVGILLAMILLALAKPKRSSKIGCVNNLKEIGLAYRIWAGDNFDKYPMDISVTNGGTLELANGRNAWINYLVMSNQLSTPKILHCPSDTDGFMATNSWSGLTNQNVSYFVGLNAALDSPQAILSGDDNFEINGVPVKSGLLEIYSNTPIAWTVKRHNLCGNIGQADGSVQAVTISGLKNLVHQTGLATNRLAIP